ncbi:DUF3427 domain-containing protein [Alkalilimnicola sp. S0819]|uniref:DUF3427 domain-containing protein n=1 Tax=Alkalilimnicola sp. S0819 TaxID=2613922 RepID=UPI00128C7B00|nr:DEAD/DEAH box helicase [Alkalilimnicola sp. S0819]
MKAGLYEQVVDAELRRALEELSAQASERDLDPAESHQILAAHLTRLIEAVLARQPSKSRLNDQLALCNQLIALLADADPGFEVEKSQLAEPVRQLMSVGEEAPGFKRPDIPLTESGLLTGTRLDPSLLSQLKKEILAADRIDILCSFVKWSGIQLLLEELQTFCRRPDTQLRVITTSYMGATDAPAVKLLAELPGAEVRVSYDVQRTRLHAKAYLFERDTGFGSAYIGSANLSRPALTEGLEWTVKVSEYASPAMWRKVAATFQTYWNDPEFEHYDETEHQRLIQALRREQGSSRPNDTHWQPAFDLRPYPFQEEILDQLAAERAEPGPHRQLVVAATGTGKTLIAAFDYRRQVSANGGQYPRLLFVAHRREILQQALASFRAVLRDQNFGDLFDGQNEPAQAEHLFASIQTLHRRRPWEAWAADAFDYVVIDETHRSAAESYQGLLDTLRPQILLGLTATPERGDGEDILRYFDNRTSAEIRLPDAITRRLLVPFHYFGVSDSEDYSQLTWERGGYRTKELDNLLTGNEVRAALVIKQVHQRLMNPHQARGLGFCVSVAHARFMARCFNKAGLPSMALSADSPAEERNGARQRLQRREINFIFTVDLYNEGVDIPEVDAVLFLRPTESLTVFLQQLGRGLRLTEDKDYLTVLDFVGQVHRNFRFDRRFRALLSNPQQSVEKEIEAGFPHLPAGCSIELERVAKERVLANVRQSVLRNRSHLVQDIARFRADTGRSPSLPEFLRVQGLEADDVYRRDSWARLCVHAGVREDFTAPDEKALTKGLRRILHVDDRLRLDAWQQWLTTGDDSEHAALVFGLCTALTGNTLKAETSAEVREWLQHNPALESELKELLSWRVAIPENRRVRQPERTQDLPLVLHASYTRDEVLAAVGESTWERRAELREGVRYCPHLNADLLFVTLNKSERDYSPSTLYEDYAISNRLFHWQSQSTTSDTSPTGRRYIENADGHRILLFVREDKKRNGLAQPYTYAGPVRYARHEGSRPMSIVWELEELLPAKLLRKWLRLVA